jgi:hypothetical protein
MAFSQINSFTSGFIHKQNRPDDISSTSLKFWYKFNSGDIVGGRLYNHVTSTYDATVLNGAAIDTTTYKTGSGSVYLNNAYSQYIDIDNFTSTTSGITIACWFKTSTGGWRRVFDFGNGSTNNNILFALNGVPSVYRGSSVTQPGSIGTYSDGNWNHIVWTLSAPTTTTTTTCTWNIYMNGSLKYNNTTASPVFTAYYPSAVSRANNYIGYSNWSSDGYTTGYFDDFRYYTREISQSEAIQLYNHTK